VAIAPPYFNRRARIFPDPNKIADAVANVPDEGMGDTGRRVSASDNLS
jgi:hypothetical protein